MDMDECIKTRRSIRKYMDIPVPFEYVVDILDAGVHAPSSGNLQAFKFLVVTDDQKRLKIAEACLDQSWISTAPVIIVIVADVEKLGKMYGLRGKKMYSIQDCACVAQNMLLRANELDLGSCFVSAFENDMIRDILDIPKDMVPQVVIPIGYADEKVPDPARYDVRDLTYFDEWDIKDVSRPWPVSKFAKPITKKAKTVHNHIKDRVYGFIDKMNNKNKKKINEDELHDMASQDFDEFDSYGLRK